MPGLWWAWECAWLCGGHGSVPGYVVGMGVCLVMWYAWDPTAITAMEAQLSL